MEIRARYILIGLFVLAVVGAGVGWVYWLYNSGGGGERTSYLVRFDGPVAGLSRGSPVLFNGLQVGEVTGLSLVADEPGAVIARIAVDARTPIRADSHVGMDFRGLTGTATVSLAGGTSTQPRLAGDERNPPLLIADQAAIKDMTQSARDVLAKLNQILTDNADPLKSAIGAIDTFATALARNSDKVDGILAGLSKLTGGDTKPPSATYDLTPPTDFPPIENMPEGQLAIPQPTAPVAFDNQRIVRQTAAGAGPAYDEVLWADSVPLLLQSRLIQGFENAGYPRIGTDGGGVSGDFQLLVDIRRFRVNATAAPTAEVDLMAKLLNADGKVVDARQFSGTTPVATSNTGPAAAAAVDSAFGKAATDLIVWVLATAAKAESGG